MNAKRIVIAAAGAIMLAATAAVPALAQMYEKITIVNSTGYTISQIYISPAHVDVWEEDVLDVDVLADGQNVRIDFRAADNTCDWDLKVVYDDGEEAVWQGLDLCEDWHFELFYNARTGDTRLVSSH